MAQQNVSTTSTTRQNRFNISQFSDQSRQSYSQYEQAFQSIERLITSSIQDEYYRTRALDRLEELSLWVMRGVSETGMAARHS